MPSRSLLFTAEEIITESHNPLKWRVVEPSWDGDMYKITPAPKAQETLGKRGQKEGKSQRIKEFAVRLCFLGTAEVNTHKVSPT